MPKPLALALAALALLSPAFASATANYVYHEQTTAIVGGACGAYLTTPSPGPTDTYPLELKIEYVSYTDNVVVYYTTDGTTPSGSFGVPAGTTTALAAAYACTFLDPISGVRDDDAASVTLPAQPAGTTVSYILGAWHSGGGPEVFANSGTCGTCVACTASSCANVFTYTVATPSDGGVDAGSSDAGADAGSDAMADAGADSAAEAGPDATTDATSDGGTFDGTASDALTFDGAALDAVAGDVGAPADEAGLPGMDAAAQGDSGLPSDGSFGFDAAGTSGPVASGCGCSMPGDAPALAWAPLAMFVALFIAVGRRKRRT